LGRTQVSGGFPSDLTSLEGSQFWGRPPVRRRDESEMFSQKQQNRYLWSFLQAGNFSCDSSEHFKR